MKRHARYMAKKRLHIIYSGTVQGVGFRWTAERVAISLGLTGWVKNMPNGTVEAVAEGEEEDLVSFIDKVKKTMNNYIRNVKVFWSESIGEFDGFNIRFF